MTTQAWTTSDRGPAAEPGTHLPFTAPLLAGVRVRLRAGAIDYILPNPAGGRGTYVAPWRMASDIAAPTLHDSVLAKRIETLPALTPASVRIAARTIAAEGYAGRSAVEAALQAQAAIKAETLRLWASLLLALIRHSDIPPREQTLALAELGNAGPGVMTSGFTKIAVRLGWEPLPLAAALEQLSNGFVALVTAGRIRRLLRLLGTVHETMQAEQAEQAREATPQSMLLERSASRVAQCRARADSGVATAAASLANPVALIARWRVAPADALAPMTAIEEILDGWDRICALWLDATGLSGQIGILPEVGLLTRMAGPPATADAPGKAAASAAAAGLNPASAPGASLVERNERVRARELAMEYTDG